MIISCPAKVNLTLEVLGRYPDGFHQIASVMQAISLADTLTLELAGDIRFHCDQPRLAGDDNLVVRAARSLKEAAGYQGGARITLAKGIPEASGLGGGSSDAAAALKGLDQLWDLGLGPQRLHEMASALGSDVPFFLTGGTAMVTGRGDRLTPVRPPGTMWLVLLRPPLVLPEKTRQLYRALAPQQYTSGEHTRHLARALEDGKPLSRELLFNAFEQVAPRIFPGLEEYKLRFLEAGAPRAHLAGSGPTLFALFEDRPKAEEVKGRLDGMESYLAHLPERLPDRSTN